MFRALGRFLAVASVIAYPAYGRKEVLGKYVVIITAFR
jgi:hypothetical protein